MNKTEEVCKIIGQCIEVLTVFLFADKISCIGEGGL